MSFPCKNTRILQYLIYLSLVPAWIIAQTPNTTTPAVPSSPPIPSIVLNGPIVDAYQTPFLYVYGTVSPNDYENKEIEKTTLDVIDKWKTIRSRVVPVKKDTEVTDNDIKNYNLILYGNERCNKILQKIAKDLSIRFRDQELVVGNHIYKNYDEGAIFIQPNPLNPAKYVLVYGALTFHGFWGMNSIRASETDYLVFNQNTRERVSQPAEPPLESGYFDKTDPTHWKVKPQPVVKPAPKTSTPAEETSYQPAVKTGIKSKSRTWN